MYQSKLQLLKKQNVLLRLFIHFDTTNNLIKNKTDIVSKAMSAHVIYDRVFISTRETEGSSKVLNLTAYETGTRSIDQNACSAII